MNSNDYYLMQADVMYDATYELDGRVCVIKKAADDTRQGLVTCQFEDGTIVRRHHAFFKRQRVSKQKFFR